jgi:HPt (histidine-containing phosphotransfer) domain-containing protein
MTVESTIDPGGIQRLLEITGGDIAFVDELITTYIEDAVVQIEALRRAAGAGTVDELVRPAHSLKSSSDGVGAVALASACRGLEAEARSGAVVDPIERVAAIAGIFDVTRTELLAARTTA